MKKQLFLIIPALILNGCASTKVAYEYADLSVTQSEMQTTKWNQLTRFPAMYPRQAVMKSLEGCATVEYVITPQNEIKDIKVVNTTHSYFADVAANVVKKWKWSDLPKNIISKPVKTQTRFDFCFDSPNQECALVEPSYSCPGEDLIFSSGRIIKTSM